MANGPYPQANAIVDNTSAATFIQKSGVMKYVLLINPTLS